MFDKIERGIYVKSVSYATPVSVYHMIYQITLKTVKSVFMKFMRKKSYTLRTKNTALTIKYVILQWTSLYEITQITKKLHTEPRA